jgi:hypothetical protein
MVLLLNMPGALRGRQRPAEGVAEDGVKAQTHSGLRFCDGWSEGETSPSYIFLTGEFMKRKVTFIFIGMLSVLIGSCATVGQYMPSTPGETVIGTIQTSFVARDLWFSKDKIINMQAYIKLLEAAVKKYPGNIDVRDIVWVTGRTIDGINVEVAATGMVISLDQNER